MAQPTRKKRLQDIETMNATEALLYKVIDRLMDMGIRVLTEDEYDTLVAADDYARIARIQESAFHDHDIPEALREQYHEVTL